MPWRSIQLDKTYLTPASSRVFLTFEEGFEKFVKIEKIFEPIEAHNEIYNDFYQLYIKVYESLSLPYKTRTALLNKNYNKQQIKDNFKGNLWRLI